ncbi:MAG: CHAD domain-containing protein [Thermoplasmata archaeon]|nr:CHAD domain-containing protein [Thermoplasmata archaeon]
MDEVVARPHPSPESLHELHREMRRLRHALALWEQLLASRHRDLVLPLDRRLKRLARLVGRVRDRDVVIELIEGPTLPRPAREEIALVARLRSRLRDDARTGRELLRVFLRSERDAHLFEGFRESLELAVRPGAGIHLASTLEEEQARRHEEAREAHRRARRRPTSVRLHRLRIQVRRLRHLTEVRTRLEGKTGNTLPPAIRRLQIRLGRLHDLDIVLGDLDPDLRSTDWVRSLKDERRATRRAIRESIRAHHWPKISLVPPAPGRPEPPTRRARS